MSMKKRIKKLEDETGPKKFPEVSCYIHWIGLPEPTKEQIEKARARYKVQHPEWDGTVCWLNWTGEEFIDEPLIKNEEDQ